MPSRFTDKWAILIGPTEYEHVQKLKYCANDVTEIGTALRKSLEFTDDHILEFGKGLKLEPSRDVIYHELGGLLQSGRIKEDDLLLFFFSGHGFREKKDYLLPSGATPHNLRQTGIEVEELVEQLTRTNSKNVVLFIDACRETISGQKGISAIGEETRAIVERKGVIAFFSCDPQDLSYEIDELQHGSFTYCLLEAINTAKCVTAGEVYDFLLREVPLVNLKFKKQVQRPHGLIEPPEKRELQIFGSNVMLSLAARHIEALMKKLGDLYADLAIEDKLFEAAVEFLDFVKDKQLTEDESRKLEWIERLATNKITAVGFAIAWEAVERRQNQLVSGTKAKLDLGPLQ
jgi:hypothetical protein